MGSRKVFLLISIVTVIALFSVSVAFVRYQMYKPNETMIISNVVLSDEVEKSSRLTGTLSVFPYGTRQVFLFFDFEKADEGSGITICWFYGEKQVRIDNYELDAASGYRSYCLLKDDGAILPRGVYSVRILQGDKQLLPDYAFNIQ